MCCATGFRGGRCRRLRAFRAVRRAGGAWMSGSVRVCGRCFWRACRRGSRRRSGSIGRGRSSMPRWSMRKGGRAGRAHDPRPPRQPFPGSRRRAWGAVGGRSLGRQRERAWLPAATDRPCLRRRPAARRGVGRPRLGRERAAHGARATRHPAADQPAPPRRRPDPGRDTHTRDLARTQALPQGRRPERPPPLAGRTHQRLAAQLASDLDPLGTPPRALPRPAPTRLLDDHPTPARMVILRPLPATGTWPPGRGPATAEGARPRRWRRGRGSARGSSARRAARGGTACRSRGRSRPCRGPSAAAPPPGSCGCGVR